MPPAPGSMDVDGLIGVLRDFNSQSEKAFLELGEVLGSLAGGARTLARCAAEMAGGGGAERFGQSVDVLEDLVEELQRIRGESESRGESLARIAALARGFRRPAREFARANRTFRLLGLYMRVEASRLKEAEAEFGALAEDIRTLASGIDECAEELDEKGAAVERGVGDGASADGHAEVGAGGKPADFGSGGEELAEARAGRQQSEATARRLAQGCTEVRDEISGLVTSLQFQDIARQRLEHVCEGWQRLGEVLQGQGAGAAELVVLRVAAVEEYAVGVGGSSGADQREPASGVAAAGAIAGGCGAPDSGGAGLGSNAGSA